MDGKHKLFDLIQRYVREELSETERTALEARMETEPGLRTQVIIQQEAYRLAKESEPIAEESQPSIAVEQPVDPSSRKYWILTLLLIALCLLVLWWISR